MTNYTPECSKLGDLMRRYGHEGICMFGVVPDHVIANLIDVEESNLAERALVNVSSGIAHVLSESSRGTGD